MASAPRYERIISIVLLVVVGLALVLLVDANPNILKLNLGGDLPAVSISWGLLALIAAVTCVGADVLARMHPDIGMRHLPVVQLGPFRQEIAPGMWLAPAFSLIGSFAFFRLFGSQLGGAAFAAVLVVAAATLFAVLVIQHYALDRRTTVSQRAQMVLQVIVYALAFGCFCAAFYARFRTLYAATLIGGSAALLSYALLQWHGTGSRLLLAAIIGIVMGQATWALNYWGAPFLLGGVALLILFYAMTGVLLHHLQGTLQRRMIWEYAGLGTILLGIVAYAVISG